MRYATENLLLSLHHTGGQEVVKVKEGAVLVVHVVLEPCLVAILRITTILHITTSNGLKNRTDTRLVDDQASA